MGGRDVAEIEMRLAAASGPNAHYITGVTPGDRLSPHQIMLTEAARDIAYLLQKVGELHDENDGLRESVGATERQLRFVKQERDALRFCITEISEDCNETDWDRVAYQRAFELVGLRHPYCRTCRDQNIVAGRCCPECGYTG